MDGYLWSLLSFFGGCFAHVATYTFGGGYFIYDGRLGGLLPFISTLEPLSKLSKLEPWQPLEECWTLVKENLALEYLTLLLLSEKKDRDCGI